MSSTNAVLYDYSYEYIAHEQCPALVSVGKRATPHHTIEVGEIVR